MTGHIHTPPLAPVPEDGQVPLPNGFTLYWKTGEQGREYWSDEIGGGVLIWHTALVCDTSLLAAIVQESALQRLESAHRERYERASKTPDA